MISAKVAKRLSEAKKAQHKNLIDLLLDTGIQLACLKGKFNAHFAIGEAKPGDPKNSTDITEENIKRLEKLGYTITRTTTFRQETIEEVKITWRTQ